MILERFANDIKLGDVVAQLRAGLIGDRVPINGRFGQKELIYADYTASGRALRQIEEFILTEVLPYYANSHTEASYCGAFITNLRQEARALIASHVNAGDDCTVIFTGSGATSAINRLVALSGVADNAGGSLPVVLVGPYEHHSNILPWRESGADVIEIPEGEGGGPDLKILKERLEFYRERPLIIGAFSAASNVTGIVSDVDAVTRLLRSYGALSCWDYAGGAPYLPIDMNPAEGLEKDAVFLSPHKFPGGPGASGLLIIRNKMVRADKPTWPGGGSVSYVSPWGHDYLDSLTEREEAGTPNVLGDIRAALVFAIKAAVGTKFIKQRDEELSARAFAVWQKNPNIQILAPDASHRLPIFSFIMRDDDGQIIHHGDVTRMLSDVYGIQARGGCACAGPYGHRLLGVERELSEQIRRSIAAGSDDDKPGWTRLNFSYLMDDKTVDFIIESVDDLARNNASQQALYRQA
ncbi:MAG: aminotransferase [Hyphomicrobiales bacterium]|nr:MAG: aminotransferase [Hyphomicrobiales bacterium]